MTAGSSAAVVREVPFGKGLRRWIHPGWGERFPWLVQGTTGRGEDPGLSDFALFGAGRAGQVTGAWLALGEALGMERLVHGRQVHGAAVRVHDGGPPGLHVAPPCDGHATAAPGVLLTVSVADCVPVSIVDPSRRVVALLHGGWRGVVAGVLERGLAVMWERLGSRAQDAHVHLGPAICGACYEVGREVHQALGREPPAGPTPVDLRAVLAERARRAGVAPGHVTVSAYCTRCEDSPFFSHRAGHAERQLAYLGLR